MSHEPIAPADCGPKRSAELQREFGAPGALLGTTTPSPENVARAAYLVGRLRAMFPFEVGTVQICDEALALLGGK